MKTITWQASNGQEIKVEISSNGVTSYLDGKIVGNDLIKIKPTIVCGKTVVAKIGKIALVPSKYNEIKSSMDEIASIAATVITRKVLVDKIGSIMAGAREEMAKSINSSVYKSTRNWESLEADARADLAKYDAAHPEEMAAIEAKRKQDIESFLASN